VAFCLFKLSVLSQYSTTEPLVLMLVSAALNLEVLQTLNTNMSVLAGAEDVLGDLGVRQALKKMPRDARL
jgi:hypothetical protein